MCLAGLLLFRKICQVIGFRHPHTTSKSPSTRRRTRTRTPGKRGGVPQKNKNRNNSRPKKCRNRIRSRSKGGRSEKSRSRSRSNSKGGGGPKKARAGAAAKGSHRRVVLQAAIIVAVRATVTVPTVVQAARRTSTGRGRNDRGEQQALQEAHALNQVLEKQLHRVCTVFSLKGTAASDWAQCALSRTQWPRPTRAPLEASPCLILSGVTGSTRCRWTCNLPPSDVATCSFCWI